MRARVPHDREDERLRLHDLREEVRPVDASNQELQQYLFDLQGYLVLHNVLGAAEVAELNRLIDARRLPSPRESIRFGSAAGKHGPDHGFLNWGEPFCR